MPPCFEQTNPDKLMQSLKMCVLELTMFCMLTIKMFTLNAGLQSLIPKTRSSPQTVWALDVYNEPIK